MNNLNKTLAIIEYVLGQDGRPATPGQVSGATGFNAATCVRIMAELVDLGYLQKISRRSGYIAGPMIFALAGRPGIYQAILENTRSILAELAEEAGATINLAVYQQGRRRILLSQAPPGGRKVSLRNSYEGADDFYGSATGRLLLSRAGAEERERVAAAAGFPGALWDGIKSMDALNNALDKIAVSDEIVFHNAEYGLWIIGAIIEAPDLPAFSFGFGVGEEKKDAAILACRSAARRINASLCRKEATGF